MRLIGIKQRNRIFARIVLGALFQLATLLVFGCVSLLAGRVAGRFNSSVKGQLFLNRAAGCVFTGLAVMLLVSSR